MTKHELPDDFVGGASETELKSSFCPCCGQPNKLRRMPEWLLLHFDGVVQRVLILMMENRRYNRSASIRELCLAAYDGAGVTAPKNAETSVRVMMKDARPKLNSLGWDYVGPAVSGKGYVLLPLE